MRLMKSSGYGNRTGSVGLFWLAAAAARRALFPFLQALPQKALFLP